jgi:hypothetical protein
VAAIVSNGSGSGSTGDRAWLEAAAAAAAVTCLRGDGRSGDARRAVLTALVGGPAADPAAIVADSRRLGVDLSGGAIAVYGRGGGDVPDELAGDAGVLIAELAPGQVLALVPLVAIAGEHPERVASVLAGRLGAIGYEAAVSAPRREPALVREAVREAMLLVELAGAPGGLAGQEETYRLLIGVLLRDPEELELLRSSTITPLLAYDAEHDTELLVTLGTFLTHHGSTTETAEAMGLHRHTVGYRLSRVHEVSGLSPYESDGRERLSLGLKAAQILTAAERL